MTREWIGVLVAAVGLAACGGQMTVGPYVKSITRVGNSLSVVSCEIVLDRGDFYDGECATQIIPLARAPRAPTAAPPAPPAPGPAHAAL